MFQDQWYVPQGESWAALFLKDAQADYLWRDTKVLECILAFEVILEKRNKQNSGFGDFSSLKQMSDSNPHYQNLNHLKIKKYIRALNKGAKGYSLFRMVSYSSGLGFKDFIKYFIQN
jgi:iron complex transport system substrate-binding protein